jgi:hypothetical protein
MGRYSVETGEMQLEWRSKNGGSMLQTMIQWIGWRKGSSNKKMVFAIKHGSLQGYAFENYLIPVFIHLEFIKAGVC